MKLLASKNTEDVQNGGSLSDTVGDKVRTKTDLSFTELFFNRELSFLAFNERVLAQAKDSKWPLLERLKFLGISSTNLDEFFETRVSLLRKQRTAGVLTNEPDNRSPQEVLRLIGNATKKLVAEQYQILNSILLPELFASNVKILPPNLWSKDLKSWLKKYFEDKILPVLSPLGLDPAHPFPRVTNKSLNFIVELDGKGAFGRDVKVAIVPAPRILPRVILVPNGENLGIYHFVLLADLIRTFMVELFSNISVKGVYQFRVTRNSNLFVDEEEIDDLMKSLAWELPSRKFGEAVRLEVESDCSDSLKELLLKQFKLTSDELYFVDGPLNLSRLMTIYDIVDLPSLKFEPLIPSRPKLLAQSPKIFEAIKKQDCLLHHPYESFAPVQDFLRQAAFDPSVLVIKQTLYRTGNESVLVDYLEEAAKRGKEVTVVVELRAKFDEEANINLANRLQEAGVHVSYGVVGYKTHAKMLMVVRRENDSIKRYVHLGTGNYHEKTARMYTDFSFFTADEEICDDVHQIFLQITGLTKPSKLKKLLHAPFTMRKKFIDHIENEIANKKAGKKAHIMAKINSLTDPEMIQMLYKASCHGVNIDLIVRGICSLRPGVLELSENIRVISIIGRFLEHVRSYYFYNDGEEIVYLSSADLMVRNLSQRVEVAFAVENDRLKKRIIKEAFSMALEDNQTSWFLEQDGIYEKIEVKDKKAEKISLQTSLIARLAGGR
ncbi:MAG: polyphosphate kinase 1 [Myxococcales bacterium]|nr:MAG: polyphosphate kinase 1 [Myxococcales bacterium]